MKIKDLLLKIKPIKYYAQGRNFLNDPLYLEVQREKYSVAKSPPRTEIINFLLSLKQHDTCYLEIGVRDPEANFNHIKATQKYSVDPGVEFESNPVDFKLTSDAFFHKLSKNEILSNDIKFDVIFIDGLHLAEQVDKDISNALRYIKDDGFIVLHDCSPPTEWHARELYNYWHTPAHGLWNGTTWKAFLKWRFNPSVKSCCIDCDWGVGILSKTHPIGESIDVVNPFFEYGVLDNNRADHLNLIDFETFKNRITS
jgi:hypothetical protein